MGGVWEDLLDFSEVVFEAPTGLSGDSLAPLIACADSLRERQRSGKGKDTTLNCIPKIFAPRKPGKYPGQAFDKYPG
jgi:hypothetical protein